MLCHDNPCLHVFSYAGQKLRSLLSCGSRGDQMQVNYPRFFCLDSAENIIISDYWSHTIQIFTKEGNLITQHNDNRRERTRSWDVIQPRRNSSNERAQFSCCLFERELWFSNIFLFIIICIYLCFRINTLVT